MPPSPSQNAPSPPAWHALSAEEVLRHLNTPPREGLSTAEARRRLARYGPNQLVEAPPPTFWQHLWAQLNSFVIWLLLAAALISALLGDFVESGAILAIVALNAALGVIQERKAEEALARLRQMAAPEAHVIRDGRRQVIPAREVVPGDIVLLEAGNYVPADVRLLEAVNLRIDESALTGESQPVSKDAAVVLDARRATGDWVNTAFMGTLVTYGRGHGVVVATGMHTQLGLIARMIQTVENEPTPLQRRLESLGRFLGWAALGISALIFTLGWMNGQPPLEMFFIAVSLAIAAVPEGLPAVVTISLALGMREMIKRHALVRRLASVETLGSTTVICSDKTGTLTQNEMTVTQVWTAGQTFHITGTGYQPQGEFLRQGERIDPTRHPALLTTLWIAALNNDAELTPSGARDQAATFAATGDPTEIALVVAAAKAGRFKPALEATFPRVAEIPFDAERKRMVTVHRLPSAKGGTFAPHDGEDAPYVVLVKGAPDIVLGLCQAVLNAQGEVRPLDEAARRRILAANEAMTSQALRVLAVAYRPLKERPERLDPAALEHDLVFAGLLGMIDPPRPEVIPALQKARRAGIRTKMITGDYLNTAVAVARQIGLWEPGAQALTGDDIERMDQDAFREAVSRTAVFARVSPAHKLRIVEALQVHGEVVAMTGDGVNDAPAIKKADIGIAMGLTGTDVTKETADMVLTDDNYASIVSAVEQGRIIYSNIRKFVYYLISCNLAEIATIFLTTLAGLPSPLKAIQLLWLNLITDGAPALALGVEKGDPDIMERPPRPPQEPIINRPMWLGILGQTLVITAATLTAYGLGLRNHPDNPALAETMGFATLAFSELLRAYTARSERHSVFTIGLFSNRAMNWAVLSSALLLLAVIYLPPLNPIFDTVPLGWAQWRIILGLLFIPAAAAEVLKALLARQRRAF